MSIWGKVIGGAAGFAIGGPLGALLGTLAGHAIDKQLPSNNSKHEAYRSIAFTAGVIALSAKMAKADGKVTKEEIITFRRLVQIPKENVEQVGKLWELAKKTTDGYDLYAQQISSLFKKEQAILERILDLLFEIAKSDGVIQESELKYLKHVSKIFNFNDQTFLRLLALHKPDNNPYEILGLSPSVDPKTVNQTWKKLIKENHPDRLIGEGMPEEFIESANHKLSLINEAYEEIKKTWELKDS